MHTVSSYLAIIESVVLKEKCKNLLELVNVCALVFLLVKCSRTGLKGKIFCKLDNFLKNRIFNMLKDKLLPDWKKP